MFSNFFATQKKEVIIPRSPSYDYLYKLLLIGDSGVGKSSILLRFSEDAFSPSFLTTVGIDFKIRTIEFEGKRIKLQIWDTAGQEQYRTITTAYFRGAMGILLVYEVSDENSFKSIRTWHKRVTQCASDDVSLILLGNKQDVNHRVITTEQGQALADEMGIPFREVSAKADSASVEEAFFTLVGDIKSRLEPRVGLSTKFAGKGWSPSPSNEGVSGGVDVVDVVDQQRRYDSAPQRTPGLACT